MLSVSAISCSSATDFRFSSAMSTIEYSRGRAARRGCAVTGAGRGVGRGVRGALSADGITLPSVAQSRVDAASRRYGACSRRRDGGANSKSAKVVRPERGVKSTAARLFEQRAGWHRSSEGGPSADEETVVISECDVPERTPLHVGDELSELLLHDAELNADRAVGDDATGRAAGLGEQSASDRQLVAHLGDRAQPGRVTSTEE